MIKLQSLFKIPLNAANSCRCLALSCASLVTYTVSNTWNFKWAVARCISAALRRVNIEITGSETRIGRVT